MTAESDGAQRYWDKSGKGHDGPWDAIVIGSGMGGMTAAALLAELGKRVLVLEQHYVPGGFTHTFRRKRWSWDVGVHAVGEVSERSLPGRILARLTRGRLRWASLGDRYDEFYFPDDVRLDFPADQRAWRDAVVAAFPDGAEAVDRYLAMCREVGRSMRGYYLARVAPGPLALPAELLLARAAKRWLDQTTADVIAGLTDDPRLRAVLAAQWGYYGSVPSRSSFAMQALVVRHFFRGAYYPEGGSGEIARQLLRTVAEAGGWTRIRADVAEIVIEKGRAVGVRLADGEELRAPRIVSAAGVMSTVDRLLPAAARGDWATPITRLRPASAHVCLYLGFKGDIRAAGAGSANKWFWHTWSCEDDAWRVDPEAEALPDAPILYCSFPSLKDPHHDPGPEQLHTGEVVTFVPWSVFEPYRDAGDGRPMKRGAEYEDFKARLTASLRAQLLRHMPALEPMIAHAELSTPLSTEHFVRPMHGSIYGIEPTPERFRCRALRPKSPIPGLYFAGSEVSGVGVIGAMMGGVLAAAAVEPRAGIRWLRET
ncbi:MAG: NAD(P)/FAD-dependent oxidoreductase [Myxococcales bacterium]|nr:NAD(P)/FAD-dependent oxidoreductase [Myxococcales bacterium]MCB9552406.1 NAD(P)/FAD-dependent oxidoreductase [Myxococcales bacterium]